MKQASRRKYHYIYKITRTFDDKFYIGMHSTENLEDGYFGSGKLITRSIKKHGIDKHVKEILEYLPCRDTLKLKEKELVNKELLEDKNCMNLKIGGEGGWPPGVGFKGFINEEHQKKCNEAGQIARSLKFKNDPIFRKKYSDRMYVVHALKLQIVSPRFSGKKHSAETRAQMSISQQGKQAGENNSQYGVRWAWVVRLNEKPKKIKLELLDEYLQQGYVRGQKKCPDDGMVDLPR